MIVLSRTQITYEESEKSNIELLYKESTDVKEQKHLLCLKLRIVHGKKGTEISEITGYSVNSVKSMISNYNKNGIDSFLYKKRESNNRKFTKDEEKEVLVGFAEIARSGQILIVSDIHKAFQDKAGKYVSLVTVYNILKRNKWRKIMPRSRHPKKASEEEIETFKKNL